MITKSQAQRLNGLISRMESTAKQFAVAGMYNGDEAQEIRDEHTEAKSKLTAYVKTLTEPKEK